jgi:Mlc titration factor MtfA (ptsG expression regulator)
MNPALRLLHWLRRRLGIHLATDVSDAAWQRACARVPWTRALDPAELLRLRDFSARFLADKAITPAGGMRLDDEQRLLIAMSCCRPVLHLDYGWLDGWRELIVYPDRFRNPRQAKRDDERGDGRRRFSLGESWWRGPLLLSWADVLRDLDHPGPGRDVVVHEIAHKLDGLHDGVDGAPRLHMDDRLGWARDFQAAYDQLCADLDAGRPAPIDPYAAESHAEFFAVCSEYWFTAPDLLEAAYPAIARRLSAFYGPA